MKIEIIVPIACMIVALLNIAFEGFRIEAVLMYSIIFGFLALFGFLGFYSMRKIGESLK